MLHSEFHGSVRKQRCSVLTVWKPRKRWACNMRKRWEMYDIVGQSLCWCDYDTDGSFSGRKSSRVCIQMCIVFKKNKGRNSEGCWFSVASCSTAENILTVEDCRNEFKLYRVQAVHPCWYNLLHNGLYCFQADRVLPAGSCGHICRFSPSKK